MKRKTWMAALMAAALSVGLMGCTAANQTQVAPQVTTSQEVVQGEEVRLAVISGPTGIGAAKLLTDSDRGETVNHYTYTIASDNNEVVSGLTSQEGEFDIAMVASNMAANLYNKTDGDVRILALGTQGVLHILEGSGGTAIQSMADLKGKTIYATGQGANPEYILRHLLTENGLDPDKDVEIVFADPTEISAKLLSGEIDTAMLPVPAATAAIAKSQGSVRDAIDLTQAWNDLDNGSQLIMSAVVARAYGFSRLKTLRLIYLPSLRPHFTAALLNGFGLAWKSGVAAEVLCPPKWAVGSSIQKARQALETPELFAWTAVIVVLSLALEGLLKLWLRPRGEGAA